jgi:Ca-activated chloride channel family protein
LDLQQVGPGNYQASFKPNDPGVYLVRARSGSQLVSAGLVHSISGETATGQVDDKLLDRVCKLTGGQLLSAGISTLPTISRSHSYFLDLTPFLLKLLILLFLIDVGIRRWENILGMFAMIRGEK